MFKENFMSELKRALKQPEPVSSTIIAKLVSEGNASQVVALMERYEHEKKLFDMQRELIKSGALEQVRVCVKENKAGGLYISHHSFRDEAKGGLNFTKHLLPAIQALVSDDDLREMVAEWFNSDRTLLVDELYVKEVK